MEGGSDTGKDDSVVERFIDDMVVEECKSSGSNDESHKPSVKELNVVPHERNWPGIVISIIVITIVCTIVGLCAYFLQPDEPATSFKYTYDFDAMFDRSWRPNDIKGKWAGGFLFYKDRYSNFIRRDGYQMKILISNETMSNLAVYQASISPDYKYALLKYNVRKVYRHSTLAEYSIYTIESGYHVPLHHRPLRLAKWGKIGSQITYVLDSDVYYMSSVEATPVAVTNSGATSLGLVVNGITDWLYEEEMFASDVAHWISNDGSLLACATFNDTLVPQADLVVYSWPYTTIEKVNYPKAGFRNPTANVYIYDLIADKKMKLRIPEAVSNSDPLLNNFVWVTGSEAIVSWSNRYQNYSTISHCVVPPSFPPNQAELQCKVVHERKALGWIENISRKPVVGQGRMLFLVEESKQGGNGNFHHILLLNFTAHPPITKFLTRGNWEVTKIVGYNPRNFRLFYISTQTSPLDRHLYSIEITNPDNSTVCHTCDGNCKYTDASMTDTSDWVLLKCEGPKVPYTSLYKDGEIVVLEENLDIAERIENAKMPRVSYESVTIAGELGLYEFSAKLYLPPGLKENQHVPVLLYVYGGPGIQMVSSQYSLNWITYLVTSKDIAVVTFDGRGSGYRGSNAMKEVSRRFGVFEIADQITAVREMLKRHKCLDAKRVGAFGWSYGGYASMKIAIHPESLRDHLMKCVIAVSPVTDWRLYDSMYTERYMGSPVDNYDNYRDASLLEKASDFKNFRLLLVHGMKDDNVHFQHTAELEKELVREEVIHSYQVYTDEAHSLSNSMSTQRHFYRMMTQFLTDCYGNS